MKIKERDNKIEKNARTYYFGKKLFFVLFVMTIISYFAFIFLYNNPETADSVIIYSVFWFLAYKLADYRVQHIETIRHYEKSKTRHDT